MLEQDTNQNFSTGEVTAVRSGSPETLGVALLQDLGLEEKGHLRDALRGLNLRDRVIRESARSYLNDQLDGADRPVLGSITNRRTIQLITKKVREEIRIRALRVCFEPIEEMVRSAERRRIGIERQIQRALNEGQNTFSDYGVDVVELKVREPMSEPRMIVLKQAETLQWMTERELAKIVEDGLLPKAMETSLARADQGTDWYLRRKPSTLLLDLAGALRPIGNPERSMLLWVVLRGPRETCEQVRETPQLPSSLRDLARLRLEVSSGRDRE